MVSDWKTWILAVRDGTNRRRLLKIDEEQVAQDRRYGGSVYTDR